MFHSSGILSQFSSELPFTHLDRQQTFLKLSSELFKRKFVDVKVIHDVLLTAMSEKAKYFRLTTSASMQGYIYRPPHYRTLIKTLPQRELQIKLHEDKFFVISRAGQTPSQLRHFRHVMCEHLHFLRKKIFNDENETNRAANYSGERQEDLLRLVTEIVFPILPPFFSASLVKTLPRLHANFMFILNCS